MSTKTNREPETARQEAGAPPRTGLSTDRVWEALTKGSLAVISYVTRRGSRGRAASCTGRSDDASTWWPTLRAGRRGTSR
jgi:hypothetical protein